MKKLIWNILIAGFIGVSPTIFLAGITSNQQSRGCVKGLVKENRIAEYEAEDVCDRYISHGQFIPAWWIISTLSILSIMAKTNYLQNPPTTNLDEID